MIANTPGKPTAHGSALQIHWCTEEYRDNTLDAMTTAVSAMLNVPKRKIPAELRNNICAYRGWKTEEDRRREGEKKKAEAKKRKADADANYERRMVEDRAKLADGEMKSKLDAQEDIVQEGDSAVLPFSP